MASPQSLFVRIQYPQSIAPLREDQLDTFLRSIQKTPPLYEYECTVNTLTFPPDETALPMDAPSLYCKTAPPYVTTKTDDLIPLILVELVFVLSVPADEARDITNAIDGLIREHLLPEKSNVSIRILVTSVDTTRADMKAFYGRSHLPLPYHHLHATAATSRMNYSVVILLAILCLGILLLNFALQFHFQ